MYICRHLNIFIHTHIFISLSKYIYNYVYSHIYVGLSVDRGLHRRRDLRVGEGGTAKVHNYNYIIMIM
jgi:hypothetical protein